MRYQDFFFNDTATTEIYTLSLHDALPIFSSAVTLVQYWPANGAGASKLSFWAATGSSIHSGSKVDRKSTRLNSSHANISYAVFCLKKKTITSSPLYVLFYLFYDLNSTRLK